MRLATADDLQAGGLVKLETAAVSGDDSGGGCDRAAAVVVGIDGCVEGGGEVGAEAGMDVEGGDDLCAGADDIFNLDVDGLGQRVVGDDLRARYSTRAEGDRVAVEGRAASAGFDLDCVIDAWGVDQGVGLRAKCVGQRCGELKARIEVFAGDRAGAEGGCGEDAEIVGGCAAADFVDSQVAAAGGVD